MIGSLSEREIVRDVLYVLQGVDGQLLQKTASGYAFNAQVGMDIPRSTQILLSWFGEMGDMYVKIAKLIEETRKTKGAITRAFGEGLGNEIQSYYRLLASLRSSLDMKETLTLRRLTSWAAAPKHRLHWLCRVVSSYTSGTPILDVLYQHAQHGDPIVVDIARTLSEGVYKPLMAHVRRWIFQGELDDPHSEFFVELQEITESNNVWDEAYTLESERIPPLITKRLAKNIYDIGKSIHFLRSYCNDGEWIAYTFDKLNRLADNVHVSALSRLENVCQRVRSETDSRLLSLIRDKYNVLEHSRAIKSYILLCQGDFVHTLIRLLSPELAAPASSMYRHNLLNILSNAMDSSNAQYEKEDIRARLDVALFPDRGETGWDVFSLDYHFRVPLNVIFTADSMSKYREISAFLIQIKRVEYVLSGLWHKHMEVHRLVKPVYEIRTLLHHCNALRNEMIQFVVSLQYYVMFHVVETEWQNYVEALNKAKHLDDVIQAHDTYLQNIYFGVLYHTSPTILQDKTHAIRKTLLALMALMIKFEKSQSSLVDAAVKVANARMSEEEVDPERDETEAVDWQFQEHVDGVFKVEFAKIYNEYKTLLGALYNQKLAFLLPKNQ